MLPVIAVILLSVTAVRALPASCPLPPPSLVAFGDSWSDNGNVLRLTNGSWPLPALYCSGRFSNGPVWNDYLANSLNLPLLNEAYGGSTTNNSVIQGYTGADSSVPVPSVADRAKSYLTPPAGKSQRIVAIWSGGNDAFFGSNVNGLDVARRIVDIVQTIAKAGGSRRFLLFQLPPLETLPYFSDKPAALKTGFSAFGQSFNAALSDLVANSVSANVNMFEVRIVPTMQIFQTISASFQNPAVACLDATTLKPCADPGSHIYWDAFHFTTAFHKQLAAAAQQVIADWVPAEGRSATIAPWSAELKSCNLGAIL
ncbi:hypothetical protein HDU67_009204 [Dinochytrium kinnereticum]|nr:hypothetical protein HDU67_009204 [Dinochytrium kinnereticum]